MVTYLLCQEKRQVRFLLPHPLFLLLTVLVLCVPAHAAAAPDLDHYAEAPSTLFVAALDRDTLFGVGFVYDSSAGLITNIRGYSYLNADRNTRELATALYDVSLGIRNAFDNLDLASSGWLEKIYRSVDTLEGISTNIYNALHEPNNIGSVYSKLVELLDWEKAEFKSDRSYWRSFWDGWTNNSMPFVTLAGSNTYGKSVPDLIAGLSGYLSYAAVGRNVTYLGSSGLDAQASSIAVTGLISNGFVGLATLIAGTSDNGRRALWSWVNPDNPADVREYEVTNLFDLFDVLGSVQNSVAKLQYVYASQDDIDFKDDEKPNTDAVKDNFFGDGEAAVDPGQIKDVAGISSDLKNSFTSPVSVGDFFSVLGDSNNYVFFSQETADNLDRVNLPATAALDDADPYAGYVLGDDGLYYPADSTLFNLYSYLEGLS